MHDELKTEAMPQIPQAAISVPLFEKELNDLIPARDPDGSPRFLLAHKAV